ncbi:TetR/AcrR family transcriptional regulator [Arthrobacter sp. PM3]|uniref:TetR/AcrR family transcriptional regulator n=1 Tax=Arthrobacter sp. PM3 TaxID=2017685 RepID=UPI000E10D2E8|nr:TetR/AcrR family transcriptional regulator [Arthrobacter sp. PM3]AXJ09889.1 hypothetical protein CFN17_09830 [Arthrobacter sp. PM3]
MRLSRVESKERTRQSLLDAAELLFAAQGPSVSLEEISEAAGLSTGAVYSNFGSKRALIASVFERMTEAQLQRIEDAVRPEYDLRQTLSVITNCWAQVGDEQVIAEARMELQVMLWALEEPELAPELGVGLAKLDERMTGLLTDRLVAAGRRTTVQDASRLLIHLRALVGYHATAAVFREPLPDLAGLGAELWRLVDQS